MTTTKHETLAAALAAFQAEIPTIVKGNTASIPTKSGGSYKYQYADLTDVTAKVLPVLAFHGLSFTAAPTFDDAGRFVLQYALLHESGDKIAGAYPLPTNGTPQEIGSAITYARRYALTAVTGVAPGGDDDDAAAAQQAHQAPRPRPVSKAPTAWRSLIADATTMDELVAVHQQASADGWLSDDVLTVLSARKTAIQGQDEQVEK